MATMLYVIGVGVVFAMTFMQVLILSELRTINARWESIDRSIWKMEVDRSIWKMEGGLRNRKGE